MMLYIKEILDTEKCLAEDMESGLQTLVTKQDLEYWLAEGVQVVGASMSADGLEVMECNLLPAPNLLKLGDAARNKLLTGMCSGVEGFDIDISSDGRLRGVLVSADYIRGNVPQWQLGPHIVAVPGAVSELMPGFLGESVHDTVYEGRLVVALLGSIRKIGVNALTSGMVSDVVFGGDVVEISGEADSCALRVMLRGYKKIPARKLGCGALHVVGGGLLDLSAASEICKYAIEMTRIRRNKVVRIGDKLKALRCIAKPFDYKMLGGSKSLVETMLRYAVVVDVPDSNSLSKISIINDRYPTSRFAVSFVLVMSRACHANMVEKLGTDGIVIGEGVFVVAVLYDGGDESKDCLLANISEYCGKPELHMPSALGCVFGRLNVIDEWG